jgi:hypothetical protein
VNACWPRRAAARPRPACRSAPTASARCHRRSWCWSCCSPTMPAAPHAPRRSAAWAQPGRRRAALCATLAATPPPDLSHPAIAVNLDACIQCTRCLRACRDEQGNDVIGLAGRGAHGADRLRHGRPDGRFHLRGLRRMCAGLPHGRAGTGTQCGHAGRARQAWSIRCAPTAAWAASSPTTSRTTTSCVEGRNGPANQGRLCVKGRYGFDYARHPHRLTVPLIRRADAPKDAVLVDPGAIARVFRVASWEEALALAGGGCARSATARPAALAGFGSAKGSNEEAYLFQKLVRTGFGSNNVDHCTRLCHASSAWWRCWKASARARVQPGDGRDAGRGGARHRCQPQRQPPGGRQLDQERRGVRHEAGRLIDPRRSDLARLAPTCSSSPTPTWRCSTR